MTIFCKEYKQLHYVSLADECSYVTELYMSTLCLQASLHDVCQDLSSNELHGQVFGEKCTTWDIKVTPHACKHSLYSMSWILG